MNRILNFFIAGIHHDSTLIANFFKDVLLSTSSHMSTNIQTILKYLDIKYSDFLDLNRLQTKQLFKNKSEEPDWRSGIIKELLTIRENQLYTNMTQGEVKMILDFASTLRWFLTRFYNKCLLYAFRYCKYFNDILPSLKSTRMILLYYDFK